MCKKREVRKIPLAEIWRRRFVLFSISLLITTLIGLVMLAVELVKLQRHFRSRTAVVGKFFNSYALRPVFTNSILGFCQYATEPDSFVRNRHFSSFLLARMLLKVSCTHCDIKKTFRKQEEIFVPRHIKFSFCDKTKPSITIHNTSGN